MAQRPWSWLLGAGIPVAWIWFALIGIHWNLMVSLFIAIAVTIIFGTLAAIIEEPSAREAR